MTKKTTSPKRSSPPAANGGASVAEGQAWAFRRLVMRWYLYEGRHGLPWRTTRDPYAVLISEVMLQQTQVERVLPYYHAWLKRWPGFTELAVASPANVIREWAGLGYNRRALNLHRLAQAVSGQHDGQLPFDEAALRALPGIGPYTASAVRSFAFDERTAVVDTNIGRLLARIFTGKATVAEAGAGTLARIAATVLPERMVRDHNLALMDLGAIRCLARKPGCSGCPVSVVCRWRLDGYPGAIARPRVAERFKETARYARGRIVDALREVASLDAADLAGRLPQAHRGRVNVYLAALERDGLVVRDQDDTWRLP
jgi:A/G-specific adenine glycosylase